MRWLLCVAFVVSCGRAQNSSLVDSEESALSTVVTIYDDAPASGWFVNAWNWPTSTTSVDSNTKASGTNAVLATENGNYSGVTFDHLSAHKSTSVKLLAAAYASVSFDFNPGSAVAAEQNSLVLTTDGTAQAALTTYATLVANTWVHVRIPMSAVSGSVANFTQLVFFDTGSTGYSFHVDNLALEPASSSSATIYGDSLANGWNLDGWGWSSSASEVASPAQGAKSILVKMTSGWGGFSLASLTATGGQKPIAAATYASLDFDINPGATVSPAMATLSLTVENGSGNFPLTSYLTSKILANTWTHVHVPLASLNTKNASYFRFDLLNFSSLSGFTFNLDNVMVSGAAIGGATGTTTGGTTGTTTGGHESWAWLYTAWQPSLNAIATNKASFTHISPTFYSVNYNYQSGVAAYSTCGSGSLGGYNCADMGTNNFDGLTTKQVTQQLTAAGMATVPAIYGGGANGGTDSGVHNLLNNTNGAATAFISAMVTEAVNNGYAGYNIDWEVTSATGSAYADKLVTFLNNFRAALAAHGMSLSFDVISSNINGTWCSGNDGYADFAKLSASTVDRIIIEDYTASLGTMSTSCQAATLSSSSPIVCPINSNGSDVTAIGMFNFMCSNLPASKIVIGLESYSGATNDMAGQAFAAMKAYGFTRVAVWPQAEAGYPFLSSAGFVSTASNWYTQLSAFIQ